uniref:DUF4158 domain-containing protein n=1 Tax=Microbispora cellulosiformans TaxID=2614688 RepID=UPI001CDA2126|nr:DUF4158 domain-containing protein [Microbispora cellulosiformans]
MLDENELIGNWTLVGNERDQLSGRRGATKLGFALLLGFYALNGRFPTGGAEFPDQVVAYVARLVDVPLQSWGCTSGMAGRDRRRTAAQERDGGQRGLPPRGGGAARAARAAPAGVG